VNYPFLSLITLLTKILGPVFRQGPNKIVFNTATAMHSE
jgi:hypothetical protein